MPKIIGFRRLTLAISILVAIVLFFVGMISDLPVYVRAEHMVNYRKLAKDFWDTFIETGFRVLTPEEAKERDEKLPNDVPPPFEGSSIPIKHVFYLKNKTETGDVIDSNYLAVWFHEKFETPPAARRCGSPPRW